MDRDLGHASSKRVVAVRLAWGFRRGMLLQVLQPQTAHMTTEHFRAIQFPDEFGRRVKMADAKIAIDDHDGVVRPLQRSQQNVWGFDHRVIVCAHRPS